ncbi:hypothetical protein NQ317_007619 [Molorchus minor]|uniref:C2H2-type domain-containing protein n=1 Tax=Molorchus minor TaxID=1323400 RepID=A0ABQ9J083_9CUCU|nr:hypothetical protein NQ317_007619 [Molorchus minor]
MLTHKQSGDVLSCEHCQYQAEDQDDFAKHLSQHKIDMKYSCIQCSYKTSLKIYLQRHMSIHKPKKKRDFVARVMYVQRHMSRKHKDMVNDESFKIVNKFLPIEKFENALNCEFCDYKTVLKCRFRETHEDT